MYQEIYATQTCEAGQGGERLPADARALGPQAAGKMRGAAIRCHCHLQIDGLI